MNTIIDLIKLFNKILSNKNVAFLPFEFHSGRKYQDQDFPWNSKLQFSFYKVLVWRSLGVSLPSLLEVAGPQVHCQRHLFEPGTLYQSQKGMRLDFHWVHLLSFFFPESFYLFHPASQPFPSDSCQSFLSLWVCFFPFSFFVFVRFLNVIGLAKRFV